MGIKIEFISEEIFGKYSKKKILVQTFLKKVKLLCLLLTKNFNLSIIAYRVFYLPIFRRIEGEGDMYHCIGNIGNYSFCLYLEKLSDV